MKSDIIQIAICFDKRMLKYALVFIESLLFFNRKLNIKIHCLFPYNEINEFTLIEDLLKSSGYSYKFYEITKEMIDSLPEIKDNRFSKATFSRFFIPSLISVEIKKILYLDVDILINGSILDLWNTDIDDFALAAVYDTFRMRYGYEDIRKLYIRQDDIYFSSGIMLINCEYWRSNNSFQKLIEYASNNINILDLPDQDAINYFYADKTKVLHPKWNYFNGIAEINPKNFSQIYPIEQLKEAEKNPVIIHFSYKRPDDEFCFHPNRKLFFKFLKHSNYKKLFNRLSLKQKLKLFILSKADPIKRGWILATDNPEYKKILRIILPAKIWEFLYLIKKISF